jgi:hypothetical protein
MDTTAPFVVPGEPSIPIKIAIATNQDLVFIVLPHEKFLRINKKQSPKSVYACNKEDLLADKRRCADPPRI